MSIRYIELPELLAIASEVLGIEQEILAKATDLGLADSALHAPAASFGGQEFYEDIPAKAAVLCFHLIGNHALPDGNKRTGHLAMRMFLAMNETSWSRPDDTYDVLLGVAAGEVSQDALISWVTRHAGGH